MIYVWHKITFNNNLKYFKRHKERIELDIMCVCVYYSRDSSI